MTSEPENIKNMVISEFMTRNVKTIRENESVGKACKLMYQENIGSIVILRKDAGIDDTKTSDTTRTSGDCLLLTRKDKW